MSNSSQETSTAYPRVTTSGASKSSSSKLSTEFTVNPKSVRFDRTLPTAQFQDRTEIFRGREEHLRIRSPKITHRATGGGIVKAAQSGDSIGEAIDNYNAREEQGCNRAGDLIYDRRVSGEVNHSEQHLLGLFHRPRAHPVYSRSDPTKKHLQEGSRTSTVCRTDPPSDLMNDPKRKRDRSCSAVGEMG